MLALAFCSQQRHNAVMSVQITIRDVPDAVRDELAARAALQGKSMQEYLRAELERLAARPPVERVLERIRAQIPVGRLGRPDEVARVVCFLAADESAYITGQVWAVNGGLDM